MIVSYSNDFCFVRIPKCGSTTCSVAIHDSGILAIDDICAEIEGGETDTYRKPVNWSLSEKLLDLHLAQGYNGNIQGMAQMVKHAPFHTMMRAGLVDSEMPCYATFRNPIDRFFSISHFIGLKHDVPADINETWDMFKDGSNVFHQYSEMFRKPQYYWLGENNTVWNIENLDDWLNQFMKDYGGKYTPRHDKKNKRPRDYSAMTKQRQQEVLDHFELDYILWEEALEKANGF